MQPPTSINRCDPYDRPATLTLMELLITYAAVLDALAVEAHNFRGKLSLPDARTRGDTQEQRVGLLGIRCRIDVLDSKSPIALKRESRTHYPRSCHAPRSY